MAGRYKSAKPLRIPLRSAAPIAQRTLPNLPLTSCPCPQLRPRWRFATRQHPFELPRYSLSNRQTPVPGSRGSALADERVVKAQIITSWLQKRLEIADILTSGCRQRRRKQKHRQNEKTDESTACCQKAITFARSTQDVSISACDEQRAILHDTPR